MIERPTARTGRPSAGRPGAAPLAAMLAGTVAAQAPDSVGADHDRELAEQALLAVQRAQYDFSLEERTELEREYNTERALVLAQMKIDDDVVKKYIELI